MVLRGFWAWLVVIALALSLTLNSFVFGFVFERLRHGFIGPPPPVAAMLRDLPPPVRDAVGRAMWDNRGRFDETIRLVEQRRVGLTETITAPQFDKERLRAQLRDVRAHLNELLSEVEDVVIDAIAKVPDGERARPR